MWIARSLVGDTKYALDMTARELVLSVCPTPVGEYEGNRNTDSRHFATISRDEWGRATIRMTCVGCGRPLRPGGWDTRWWWDSYVIEEEPW